MQRTQQQGFILPMVVVFGAIFLTLALGLTGYLFGMQRSEQARIQREGAFDIAEAGVNYYAWHLAHFPTDLRDGTGSAGPYVHEYRDPEGDAAGTFSLGVTGNYQCSQLLSIDITSEGKTTENPNRSATIVARYAQPSVAEYAYIVNANAWVAQNRNILGRFHSNYGIRMDGNNLSTVESSVPSWTCTSSFGCDPSATKPGVFGAGTNPTWWQYPISQMDFGSITGNLSAVKTAAQSGGGVYFGTLSGDQNQRGYHAIFKQNGTVDVYQVTGTTAVWSYSSLTNDWAQEYNIIAAQTYMGNYAIPSGCSAFFFDSRVWLEGVVKGRVTVASASDIITPNNITYAATGSNGLTAIAQKNITVPLNCPTDLTLKGVFVAQTGRFGRNYYFYQGGNYYSVPSSYSSYVLRNSITTVGSIVSNAMPVTVWGGSNPTSGFITNNPTYDGTLAKNPPPFTPFTSTQYQFVSWRQL